MLSLLLDYQASPSVEVNASIHKSQRIDLEEEPEASNSGVESIVGSQCPLTVLEAYYSQRWSQRYSLQSASRSTGSQSIGLQSLHLIPTATLAYCRVIEFDSHDRIDLQIYSLYYD